MSLSRRPSKDSKRSSGFLSLQRSISNMTGRNSSSRSHDPSSGLQQVRQNPTGENGELLSYEGVFKSPDPGCKTSPPASLKPDQERKLNEMITHFKNAKDFPVHTKPGAERKPASEWEKLRLLTREGLLRYLRATKWDLTSAKQRLEATLVWRREFGVDDLSAESVEPEAKSGKETVMGFDNKGRPLHYMHPHRNDTNETPRQMQFAVWILERCIDMMPPGVEQLALLINFDNRSRNPTSISNAKLMLYILQNHYVERLGIALCINVPWIFKGFWNVIQPFVDPVTKNKCKFDEAIKGEVPANQLARDFGGQLDFKYDHDKYWPDLVKTCQVKREGMLRRFKEQCNSEVGASEWVIRGGDESESEASAAEEKETAQHAQAHLSAEEDAQKGTAIAGGAAGVAVGAAGAAGPEKDAAATGQATDQEPADVPETPLEKFQTPRSTVDENPLEREFSTLTKAPSRGANVLETTDEHPAAAEPDSAADGSAGAASAIAAGAAGNSAASAHADEGKDEGKKSQKSHHHNNTHHASKHGDVSFMAATVAGIGSALAGGAVGNGAAEHAAEEARRASVEHARHGGGKKADESNGNGNGSANGNGEAKGRGLFHHIIHPEHAEDLAKAPPSDLPPANGAASHGLGEVRTEAEGQSAQAAA